LLISLGRRVILFCGSHYGNESLIRYFWQILRTMSHTIFVDVITMCRTIFVGVIRIRAASSFTSPFPKVHSALRPIKS